MQSHTVQVSFSLLYFTTACCIEGTCGAAISTGRFMDVETTPVFRWVQFKADATPVNEVCMCMCVCGKGMLSDIDRERGGGGIRWEPMLAELL